MLAVIADEENILASGVGLVESTLSEGRIVGMDKRNRSDD